MIKKIATIFCVLIGIFCVATSVKAASDFTLEELDFQVELQENGDMKVTETWNIQIHSETNTLFKTFDLKQGKYAMKDIQVEDVTEKQPFVEIDEYMYYVTTGNFYAMENQEGDFEIAWGINQETGEKQYKISYTVEDAVTIYEDCAELYWQFIGEEFQQSIEKVTGKITLPQEVSVQDNLRAWAHGPLNGEITIDSKDTVSFSVEPYLEGKFVEIRLGILEPEIFSESTNYVAEEYFQDILREEESWAEMANRERMLNFIMRAIIWGIIIVGGITICIVGIIKSVKYAKILKQAPDLKPTQELDYYREIPNENQMIPTEAAFLYYFNRSGMPQHMPKILSATMLDFGLKKYLAIEIRKEEEEKKEKIIIRLLPENIKENLKESENLIYQLFTKIAAKNKKTPTEFTMEDIEKYAKKYSKTFLSTLEKVSSQTEKEQTAEENYDPKTRKIHDKWNAKGTLLIFISVIVACFAIFFPPIWVGILIAIVPVIICIVYSYKIAGRYKGLTQKGVDEQEQLEALKRYMENFSLLEEKEVPALVVWEKYLVYATVFGIADKVLQQLEVKYPEFTDEDYMRNTTYFYILTNHHFGTSFVNAIDSSMTKAYQSSVASSSASSGGGYGGGFSGGGGGRRPVVAGGGGR